MSSQKWSEKQDLKLRRAVQKYGTQWSYITKKFKFNRTLNSVIKRWHGKLKIQNSSNQNIVNKQNNLQENHQKYQNNPRPKISRISRSRNSKISTLKKERKTENSSFLQKTKVISKINNKQLNDKLKMQSVPIKKSQLEQLQEQNSESSYIFQKQWKNYQDNKLKQLILQEGILNWQSLANLLQVQSVKEVRKRWSLQIYPMIKHQTKIGGCFMYSVQQDKILENGFKKAIQTNKVKQFLPGRSQYSIDARRRRISKGLTQNQIQQNKHLANKLVLKKILLKMHKYYEKPKQQQDFIFGSD